MTAMSQRTKKPVSRSMIVTNVQYITDSVFMETRRIIIIVTTAETAQAVSTPARILSSVTMYSYLSGSLMKT